MFRLLKQSKIPAQFMLDIEVVFQGSQTLKTGYFLHEETQLAELYSEVSMDLFQFSPFFFKLSLLLIDSSL